MTVHAVHTFGLCTPWHSPAYPKNEAAEPHTIDIIARFFVVTVH